MIWRWPSTAVWLLKHCSKPPLLVFTMRLLGSVKLSCALGSGEPNARLILLGAGSGDEGDDEGSSGGTSGGAFFSSGRRLLCVSASCRRSSSRFLAA